MLRSRPFPAGRAALLAALLVPAVAWAELPWSDARTPWRIGPRSVVEGRHRAVLDGVRLRSDFYGRTRSRSLPASPAGQPVLSAGHPLLEALHRMALEEAGLSVRPDGALMAGAEWPGVWTRDVSYATHLALATLLPDAARASLRAKTFGLRVRQDTGTGGAWPVSTDRAVWTLAAWEVYLATGDREWLAWAHRRALRMAVEDRATACDPRTGLVFGESSFMDWREQTYPGWMQPADIYQTRALGTNVAHAASWRILARMQRALGRGAGAGLWDARADELEAAILRHFTIRRGDPLAALVYPDPDGGTSGQTEALGNALAILTGLIPPERARRVIDRYPLTAFGVPTIHPQLPGVPPYHNRSVWPFVQAYWALAGARAGHAEVFHHGLGTLTRAAALMLTNKENMMAEDGRPEGTAINSDRQLWSVAGFLALIHRGLFGLELTEGGLRFAPVVPDALADPIRLSGLRVRGAVLDLEVHGHGDTLATLELDGRPLDPGLAIPFPGAGRHRVVMRVMTRAMPRVMPRGERVTTASSLLILPPGTLPSAHPRPMRTATAAPAVSIEVPAGPATEASTSFEAEVSAGAYAVAAVYANGAGPINTDSRCALRALLVDGRRAGVLVMPQRGTGAWDSFGESSAVRVTLAAGRHALTLAPDALALNMENAPGLARLRALVLRRVTGP